MRRVKHDDISFKDKKPIYRRNNVASSRYSQFVRISNEIVVITRRSGPFVSYFLPPRSIRYRFYDFSLEDGRVISLLLYFSIIFQVFERTVIEEGRNISQYTARLNKNDELIHNYGSEKR